MCLYKKKVKDSANASNLEEKEELIQEITAYNIIQIPDEIEEWVRAQTSRLQKTASELKNRSLRFYKI